VALADLVRMANQISENFSYEPPASAANDVATHLRAFWSPGMREEILAYERDNGAELSEVTRLALQRLSAIE
jgi:formate dehydrogenase subunit delta